MTKRVYEVHLYDSAYNEEMRTFLRKSDAVKFARSNATKYFGVEVILQEVTYDDRGYVEDFGDFEVVCEWTNYGRDYSC